MGQCTSNYAQENSDRESCACRGRRKHRNGSHHHDSFIYNSQQRKQNKGQYHLLYNKKSKPFICVEEEPEEETPTMLVERVKDGTKHIYAVRSHEEPLGAPEQRPVSPTRPAAQDEDLTPSPEPVAASSPPSGDKESPTEKLDIYSPQAMAALPPVPLAELVCVSHQHAVYVCDTGLTSSQCDELVLETEQACRGHYAAYTYAKQTLGCREFKTLAQSCLNPVHTVCSTIRGLLDENPNLVLDDREPHMVKYDISKKERQKLDMHTDKSEWTFLIALSDGCGLDYDGGGTFFEALDATVHIQRGHALIFPGKLRHCGRKISKGLRFLLVGFLVDKAQQQLQQQQQQQQSQAKKTVTVTTVHKVKGKSSGKAQKQ